MGEGLALLGVLRWWQVLLKEMARETGHKSLNGLEVVALTCAPHTGSLQVVRRAWCSSVGRGFFYE